VPSIIDEYLFSGIIRGEPVEVVKCVTSDLKVPAHAEIVLEGYVELGERRREGPFGDHTGYYSLADDPGQAFRVMNFAWSMGQMMFTKFVIVVDEHVDPHDYSQVAWRCFNNVDPVRDVLVSKGPLDVLDHSSPHERFGHKMGIDATKPLPEEGHGREWPEELEMDPDVVRRVDELWEELGLE
jgi:3-polyprenyl-4-hydroxybenzoate decarboxylase